MHRYIYKKQYLFSQNKLGYCPQTPSEKNLDSIALMFVCELCYLQETNAENQIQIFLCREDIFAVDIVDALFHHYKC